MSKASKAQYDEGDCFDDEYDEYTPQPTDEYYDDNDGSDAAPAPPQAPAVQTVTFLADEERKRKEAAELRKQQAAAEAKNKAEAAATAADAKTWLAQRDLLPIGVDDVAVVALYTSLKARRDAAVAEMGMWATQIPSGVPFSVDHSQGAHLSERSVNARIAAGEHYYSISVAWQSYPGVGSVTLQTSDEGAREVISYATQHSEHCAAAGFATMVMRFCVALAEETEGSLTVDVRKAWADATGGENLDAEAKKRGVVFIEPAPPKSPPAPRNEVKVPAASTPQLNRFQRAKEYREAFGNCYKFSQQAAVVAKAAARAAYTRRKYDMMQDRYETERFSQTVSTTVEAKPTSFLWTGGRLGAAAPSVDAINAKIVELKQQYDDGHVVEMLTYVRDKALTLMPPTIKELSFLTQLDLTNCGLRSLPPLGDMRLKKLYLGSNNFTTIPTSILTANSSELRVLDMSRNTIVAITPALAQLVGLEVLQMEYNSICDVKCDFGLMPRLEVIELTDNNIRQLPASIGGLERLWRLRIAANPLTQIPPEVYHKGVKAIKQFFRELSPQNLPIPPTTLRTELAQVARREGGCDAEVHFVKCDIRATLLAAVLQARLPGLERKVTTVAKHSLDVVALIEDDVTTVAANAFMELVMGDLTGIAWQKLPVKGQLELTALVERYGSPGLVHQLTATERGEFVDPSAYLADDLESWWGDGIGRNVRGRVARFRVGGDIEITVHRELLCARSEYFSRMLRGGLAESAMDVVPLDGVDADVFREFIAYVYGDNTSKMTPENVVSLLFMAVEYDCARLKAMAECVVGLNVDATNCSQVLQIAEYLDATRLRKACVFYAATNLRAVMRSEGWWELPPQLRAEIEAMASGEAF